MGYETLLHFQLYFGRRGTYGFADQTSAVIPFPWTSFGNRPVAMETSDFDFPASVSIFESEVFKMKLRTRTSYMESSFVKVKCFHDAILFFSHTSLERS